MKSSWPGAISVLGAALVAEQVGSAVGDVALTTAATNRADAVVGGSHRPARAAEHIHLQALRVLVVVIVAADVELTMVPWSKLSGLGRSKLVPLELEEGGRAAHVVVVAAVVKPMTAAPQHQYLHRRSCWQGR